MDYGGYLRLDRLLDAQAPVSVARGRPAHDEHLFIIVHQAYELWFKQILHELDLIQGVFAAPVVDDRDFGRVLRAAERIVAIQRLLVTQVDVLETMTPMDFLEFRDLLTPASGFQSRQFRLIEVRLGLPAERRVTYDGHHFEDRLPAEDRAAVAAAAARPSLHDQIAAWLARTPFVETGGFDFQGAYRAALDRGLAEDIETVGANPALGASEREAQIAALKRARAMLDSLIDEAAFETLRAEGIWRMERRALQAALFVMLYRDEPALQGPHKLISLVMDMDELWAAWRMRHALMVGRMIGRKAGTGGSSGASYLREAADRHRVFDDFFALATFLAPRSRLPELPGPVRAAMRYAYAP